MRGDDGDEARDVVDRGVDLRRARVVECVGQAIAASDDPLASLANGNFITEAISVCSR